MTETPWIRRAPPMHWVGDGFPVRSMFSYAEGPQWSPFLLLDHAAPSNFPPATTPPGVGPHPHRGFETVTVVFAGEVAHRDSAGHGGTIGPGDVQWMTAASGVVHEEFHSEAFTERGGEMEMVQLWVNLPARAKMSPPRYQDLRDAMIPRVALAQDAGTVRVIAGSFAGSSGPAHTETPIELWDVALQPHGELRAELAATTTKIVLVRRGELLVDGKHTVAQNELARMLAGAGALSLRATGGGAEFLVIAGEPIDEPVAGHGPFVMNTREEIETAMRDYQAGRMGAL
jgi:quercetin 2,3-dioxygenase